MQQKILFICCFVVIQTLFNPCSAQINQPQVGYKLVRPDKVESKNFYFTFLLNQSSKLKETFIEDTVLSKIARNKYLKLTKSGNTPSEISNTLKFSEKEIGIIASRLADIYNNEQELRNLYRKHVVPSGCYFLIVSNSSSDVDNIKKIWEQDAKAMNRLIDVYGIGSMPYYPGIDSISYPVNGEKHKELMLSTKSLILFEAKYDSIFYHIPSYTAELLLDLNDRDETIVYEPLWDKENKSAYERVKVVDWAKYPYSAVVILGYGPDNYDFPLNPGAKIRLRIAAEKFKEEVAPFIIVTGGKVHPFKTKNVEAYHMKQYLMENFNIPEDNIIIEPHARHTTSNIRNTARIIFRNGIPVTKPILVSSSEVHINSISGRPFAERCKRELGLVPYKLGKRIDRNFVTLYPLPNALQINPREPLDP